MSNVKLVQNILNKEKLEHVPTRNGYGEGLVLAGKENQDVVVLGADLSESTRAAMFKKEFPDRFIQCGIAEQNMTNVAAGLALAGKIPFVSTYAVFSPGMNWSPLRVSVIQSDANVKVAGAHAGISVGPDGMSHQALEDIALTRVLPHMTVVVPADEEQARQATLALARHQGPCYLRLARAESPALTGQTKFELGQAQVLQAGSDVTVVACGLMAAEAIKAAQVLKKNGISAEVINLHTIKPLDKNTILKSLHKTKSLVTVEEHQVAGGMGSAVLEAIASDFPVPARLVGVNDKFGQSGSAQQLLNKHQLNCEGIVQAVLQIKNSASS